VLPIILYLQFINLIYFSEVFVTLIDFIMRSTESGGNSGANVKTSSLRFVGGSPELNQPATANLVEESSSLIVFSNYIGIDKV
jgi:hypothetical protein